MQIPFLGGSYEARSTGLNTQKSINCFPVIDNKEPKDVLSMYGTPGLKFFAQATVYGAGTDGAVTLTTNTTLFRDMQYTTLTVNSGVTLDTAGFVITASVAVINNGVITDSTNGGSGGAGGVGYLNDGTVGGDALINGAGVGGDGGHGRGDSGVGGSGGVGGGYVKIFAKTLTNNGTIHANAGNATAVSGVGDGGDGGDGGSVLLTYDARTIGTVTAAAGTHTNGVANGVDSYVKMLILANDADGTAGTGITNSAPATAVVITASGNAAVSTADFKFGNGCVSMPTVYDYLSVPAAVGQSIGSGSWTFDTWWKPTTLTGVLNTFIQQYTTEGTGIRAYYYGFSTGSIYIDVSTAFVIQAYAVCVSQAANITLNSWNHIAIVGTGSAFKVFVNGVLQTISINTFTSYTWPSLATPVQFGPVYGKIAEARLSVGSARWSTSFTVPTSPYSPQVDGVDGAAGTTSWINVPNFAFSSATFRGGIVAGTKLYVAMGANILSVTTAGLVTYLGTITTTTGNVIMAYNGTQVLIVDGTAYGHYVVTSSGTLTDISDADFPASTSCAFIDGYFVVTKASSGQFFISGLNDAATWDALDFGTAEGSPDNLVRCFQANNNLWLAGESVIEVWYNSGNADFPFVRVQGALVEDGLAGSLAICLIKDQLYFLSDKLEVLRTVGYQREKVSTIHLDKEIQSYTTTSDAVAYEYRADGHVFLVLTFPTVGKTFVYDTTTDYWHEWQSYNNTATDSLPQALINSVLSANTTTYYGADSSYKVYVTASSTAASIYAYDLTGSTWQAVQSSTIVDVADTDLPTSIKEDVTSHGAVVFEFDIASVVFYFLMYADYSVGYYYNEPTLEWVTSFPVAAVTDKTSVLGELVYGRHRGALGFFFNKKWIVGDHTNGRLYELDMATYTDDGQIIKRTRRTQIIDKNRHYVLHHLLNLDFDTGIGAGGSGSGSDPEVALTWSDDGANTWSTAQTRKLGMSGEYSTRAIWRRLGKSRSRVYELTISEPVKFVLKSADAELEELGA